jgi:hypothetical protein
VTTTAPISEVLDTCVPPHGWKSIKASPPMRIVRMLQSPLEWSHHEPRGRQRRRLLRPALGGCRVDRRQEVDHWRRQDRLGALVCPGRQLRGIAARQQGGACEARQDAAKDHGP